MLDRHDDRHDDDRYEDRYDDDHDRDDDDELERELRAMHGRRSDILRAGEARSIHWSPYDRVGAVNADP